MQRSHSEYHITRLNHENIYRSRNTYVEATGTFSLIFGMKAFRGLTVATLGCLAALSGDETSSPCPRFKLRVGRAGPDGLTTLCPLVLPPWTPGS